ncbi:type II secretion system protein N [Marinicauda algicola]|nr:type II secretion system protein N [Marinicauda algicola]
MNAVESMGQAGTAGRTPARIGRARLAAGTAEIALAALIALLLARALWFVVYGADAVRIDLDLAGPAPAERAGESGADLSILSEGVLFAARATPDAGEAVADAPETQLDLTLRGVRRGSDPQSGTAVVQSPELGQRTLPVGAEIAPGVVLEAVYSDRVIINRRGVRESLLLREDARARTSLLRPAGEDAPEAVETTVTPPPASPGAARLTEADWVRGLRLERAETAGEAVGYGVLDTSDPVLLDTVGLQAGDIITHVNGRALTGSVNTLEVLEELAESSRASFVVLRGGEARTIEVNLR